MHEPPPLSPPLAPEPALQTAARLLAEGRPDAAVVRLRALLAEAPTYAAAHVLHATALEAAGQRAEALDAWSHAALLVPRSPLVRRERQRLASLFAPKPEAAPEPEAAEEEPMPPTAPDTPDERLETHALDLDVPSIEGFPLDGLTTHFETDTPLFEDDEPDAGSPLALSDASETPHDEASGAFLPDWGDLPPLSAPLLPPGTDPVPARPTPPSAPEPDDWRVIDVTEGPDIPAEPPTPGLTFEHPFAPSAPTPPTSEPTLPETVAPDPMTRPAPPQEAGDDLDALISRLEHAPRIRPDPAFAGPAMRPDESGVDDMVSETLAKIYAAQHRYVEAAVMYEKLAAREPAQADVLLRRAAELREKR